MPEWLIYLLPFVGAICLAAAVGLALLWDQILSDREADPKTLPPMSAEWRESKDQHRQQ